MTGEQGDHQGEELVERLREAGNEMTAVIALLWTWLEGRLLDLGSLREKPSAIRSRALAARFDEMNERVLEWVAESPLRNAAELLARIDCRYGEANAGLVSTSVSFDDTPVVVSWRRSDLPRRAGGGDYPPAADEQPSLSTLAPAILVCPATVKGIELRVTRPTGPEWELARQKLEVGMVEGEPILEIHLDSLGDAGRSEWWVDPSHVLVALREQEVQPEQRAEALEAVRSAVREAAGPSRILVLPELVATDEVLMAIREELRSLSPAAAPALTVVGRYHQPCEDIADHPELGCYVNEAVVLGPLGGTLWSHRKLSSAADDVETEDGSRKIVEDIRLGRSLDVVDSPLGSLAVAICLDTFAGHSRERLARSPANVLLVPSLSPKVVRHQASLWHLAQVLFGIAFVCNRAVIPVSGRSSWNDPDNRSFWAIQRECIEPPSSNGAGRPSFIFRLSERG